MYGFVVERWSVGDENDGGGDHIGQCLAEDPQIDERWVDQVSDPVHADEDDRHRQAAGPAEHERR